MGKDQHLIPNETRLKIVSLWLDQHLTLKQIETRLQDDNISVHRSTISRVITKYSETGYVQNRSKSGRKSKYPNVVKATIDRLMKEDQELTSPLIRKKLLEETGLDLPLSTIRTLRREIGWVQCPTDFRPMVRLPNQEKRLTFCRQLLITKEEFNDVVFTDETSIQIERNATMSFKKISHNEENNMTLEIPPPVGVRPKHPLKVHAWAGISRRGATNIVLFNGIMDAKFYCSILTDVLSPWIKRKFPEGHRLQADNDPKHTSRLALKTLADERINWWRTPPESPDLNPIELVWHQLKQHLRQHVKPTNLDELKDGITTFWSQKMNKQLCNNYINHIKKVIPDVIAADGKSTSH